MPQHIVYATVRTPNEHLHARVSEPMSWDAAINRWYALDDMRRDGADLRTRGTAIKFFSVRAENDPSWPTDDIIRPVINASDSYSII